MTGRGEVGSFALTDGLRTAADPRATLLAFLESAYRAGAVAAEWDIADLTSVWCPARHSTVPFQE